MIEGKFEIILVVKEFAEYAEQIQLHPIANYSESCQNWNGVKESVRFFMKRVEKKLNER